VNIEEKIVALSDKYRCPDCGHAMVGADTRPGGPLFEHLPTKVEVALLCPSCHHVESGDDRL
jgi:rubredoxin